MPDPFKISEHDARELINGVSLRHLGFPVQTEIKEDLVKLLTGFELGNGDGLDLVLPCDSGDAITYNDSNADITHHLYLRRLVFHDKIGKVKPDVSFLEGAGAYFGSYSSSVILRDLVKNQLLVDLMKHSSVPYSLLGRHRIDNREEEPVNGYSGLTGDSDGPFLSIPGVEGDDLEIVRDFEAKHTTVYNQDD
jgi:hypothetical protein